MEPPPKANRLHRATGSHDLEPWQKHLHLVSSFIANYKFKIKRSTTHINTLHTDPHLIAECYKRGIPLVTCGGAGGRIDAGSIAVADLARSCGDNMLSQLRKTLRREYELPLQDKCPEIGIRCVYSPERPRFPKCDGTVSCEREAHQKGGIGCASGFGSATHITGTFGFMMAGEALNILTQDPA